MAKIKKYRQPKKPETRAEELMLPLIPARKPVAVADFSFRKLKRLADSVPFTQTDWANMLHLSERTLQRYAKTNASFEGIYTDRILLLQELIALGLDTFTGADVFYDWLKKDKHVMGRTLNFESLFTERGIQETIQQLSRIQQGVYA